MEAPSWVNRFDNRQTPTHSRSESKDDAWISYPDYNEVSETGKSVHASQSYGEFGETTSSKSGSHVIPRTRNVDSEDPGSISDVQGKFVKRKKRRQPDDTSGYITSEFSDLDNSPRRLCYDRDRRNVRNRSREQLFDNESEISGMSEPSRDPRGKGQQRDGRSRSYDNGSEISVNSRLSSNAPSGKPAKKINSRDDSIDSRSEMSLNTRVSANPAGRHIPRLRASSDSLDSRSEISLNSKSANHAQRQNRRLHRSTDSVDDKSGISLNSRVSKDNSVQHARREARVHRPNANRTKQSLSSIEVNNKQNFEDSQSANIGKQHYVKRTGTTNIPHTPNKPGILTANSDSLEPFAFIQPDSQPINIRIRKLMGPIMGVLLLIILAASLGAAIYFATALKETQENEIEMLRANLALKIRSSRYSQNLDDLSKSDFNNLALNYCGEMDDLYRRSHFRNTYRGCEVISIRHDNINFTLFFVEKDASKSDIISVIETSAPKAEEMMNVAVIDKLEIELGTIKIKIEHKTAAVGFNKIVNDEEIEELTFATKASTNNDVRTSIETSTTLKTTTTKKPAVTEAPRKRKTTPLTPDNGEQAVYSWDPCAEYEGNYFPHPVNCSLYFQCQNSASILRTCAPGLVYDFHNTVCVMASEKIPCPDPSKAPEQPTTVKLDKKAETAATTQAPAVRQKPIVKVIPKPIRMNSTKSLRPEYPIDPCSSGDVGGHYPHPDDCTRFIQCVSDGTAVELPCAPGLVFDPEKPGCVFPPNDLFCPDIKPCAEFDDGYFPHPFNCSLFIQCEFGKEKVQACQSGLVWSSKINSCVHRTPAITCTDSSKR